jgi:hypothetical protein
MKNGLTFKKSRWTIGFILCLTLMFGSTPLSFARESTFTRGGTGPLYWSTYEYQYTKDAPMDESEWKKNIDWIAKEYKSYGYDMVVTDGWIEPSQLTNENGYIVSHNDQWVHDWKYWIDYVNSKDLKLGVYYNPLWVTRSAATDPSKKVIGTNYRVMDIVTEGDVFNKDLYWVDVTKPGAKEYVQGYVQYFKNLGVPYLRIDFLSWYENGIDKGRKIGVNHGTENYRTALAWMHEAAGDEMQLSLVMPHLFEHGKNELLYGDMIRINEDLARGGWQNLSGQRQNWVDSWSQWANPFTGFTGFSDVAGRGSPIILDGDFIRMNTFQNDDERETIINLFTMAGSPIAITDQYSTIGPHGEFYKNKNMINLNKQGFVGKPYYYNSNPFSVDPNSRDTERWLGQLPDGSWIVGLFNRDDRSSVRSINYIRDLGLSGSAKTKDLWTNENVGVISEFKPLLKPHASKVVQITPADATKKYQAEVATWIGGAKFNNNHPHYQGFGFVDHLGKSGAKVVIAVEVPRDGNYEVNWRYANGLNTKSTMHVSVVNAQGQRVQSLKQIEFKSLNNWSSWANQNDQVSLQKGVNLITIERTALDQGAINLDYLELNTEKRNNKKNIDIANNGFETGNISGWYEWHPIGSPSHVWVDTNNENNGKYKAYFWSNQAYKQSLHQTFTGLDAGTYQVRAIVKYRDYRKPANIVRMELRPHAREIQYVNIKSTSKYQSIKDTVIVRDGKLDVGFYVDSNGHTSLQIDQVFIKKLK